MHYLSFKFPLVPLLCILTTAVQAETKSPAVKATSNATDKTDNKEASKQSVEQEQEKIKSSRWLPVSDGKSKPPASKKPGVGFSCTNRTGQKYNPTDAGYEDCVQQLKEQNQEKGYVDPHYKPQDHPKAGASVGSEVSFSK